ncbi:hypothetical protein N4G62_07300 [Sphingomonas sanguinis]|uniref:Uncharacterized protein n=1 Tax=Sphingomonas sanguinis TaxID=33051 RepID=A0ABU5LQ26_9SPHN|nr:hypothetical protein [Sphingomonas sanguinis]MDZ7281830.1 hypothetical protein [Sphingomonas sanguinis]
MADPLARLPSMVIGGAAIALALAATIDTFRQVQVDQMVEAAADQATALARGNKAEVRAVARALPSLQDPRAQVAGALILARAATVATNETERQTQLGDAGRLLASANARRPDWAEGQVSASFVSSLLAGEAAKRLAARQLADSYRAAPFLRDSGLWRVREGLSSWSQLPAWSQSRLVDEGVWLARLNDPLRADVFDMVRGSPAYPAFAQRWLELRQGDADLRGARADRTAP